MNGLQFLALAIASATLYWYATHDVRKTMTIWPENKNPILTVMKETFDPGDAWGSNINWLFALCDVATVFDVSIPSELEFSQSPFGADDDCYEYQAIIGLLSPSVYIHEPLTLEEFRKHVEHALKVLARYDSILRLEGKDY